MAVERTPPDCDAVFLRGLAMTVSVGLDAWHRPNKPQPVVLDIKISTNFAQAADKDDVRYSINYGDLCRTVVSRIQAKTAFESILLLANEACCAALSLAGTESRVELTLTLPKAALLAETVGVTKIMTREEWKPEHGSQLFSKTDHESLFVRGIKLPCIIGVNHHERLEKQYVVVDLTFFDVQGEVGVRSELCIDYATVVKTITDFIEASSYQTVEALASHVCEIALTGIGVRGVTVAIQKPSAITSVAGSGVQITRRKTGL